MMDFLSSLFKFFLVSAAILFCWWLADKILNGFDCVFFHDEYLQAKKQREEKAAAKKAKHSAQEEQNIK